MNVWYGIAFSGLVGWLGGYCYGWLMGQKATHRRWSEAVVHTIRARKSNDTNDTETD